MDRENFHDGIDNFKSFFDKKGDEYSHIDPEIKNKIEAILEIENSNYFKICDLISDRADHFSRYFFLIGLCFYFAYFLMLIDESNSAIPFFVLGAMILGLYTTLKLRFRMKRSNLSCKNACLYYLRCRCVHKA